MQTLSIDIETYSSINLQKAGVYRYVEAPDFEILCSGIVLTPVPFRLSILPAARRFRTLRWEALTDDTVIKWAFNANFERICLSQHLKNMGKASILSMTIIRSRRSAHDISIRKAGAVP